MRYGMDTMNAIKAMNAMRDAGSAIGDMRYGITGSGKKNRVRSRMPRYEAWSGEPKKNR